MPRFDYKALLLALGAEMGADLLISLTAFAWFADGSLTPDMSDAEITEATRTVLATTHYLTFMMVSGTLTTIAGGYFAARLAGRIPYYHGLAMGVLGIVLVLMFARDDPAWFFYVGLLTTLPASIYGAHLAKRHLATPP
jgi:hypothetical protein